MTRPPRACRLFIALAAFGFGLTAARADPVTFVTQFPFTGSVTTGDHSETFDLGGVLRLMPLGDLLLTDQGEIIFATDPLPGEAVTYFGRFVYTAANGDQLFGTSLQVLAPPGAAGLAALTVYHTITGGTGLFSVAAGEIVITGQFDGQTGTGLARGTISAPGLAAIPEPGALLLVGTGLAAAFLRRRRRGRTAT
jgi:hypothetical protein